METMWMIPVLMVGAFVALELARVRRALRVEPLDHEAALLLRDHRVQQLSATLAQAPIVVRCLRSSGLTNRIVLDLGGDEIDARCYHPPRRPISVLTGLTYRPSQGWLIGVDGPRGPATLSAWVLDVHPSRAG